MNHYHHLTTNERESILFLRAQGKSICSIAQALGRSSSTISRELRRNCTKGQYFPSKADQKYRKRRKKCRRQKILKDPAANELVRKLFLEQKWSPEQISKRLEYEQNVLQVSTNTIYRAIYGGLLGKAPRSQHLGVNRYLRHHGKPRKSKRKDETRGKIRISHPISERPAEANDRMQIGHLEADTVIGKIGSLCLLTVVDRRSRYVLIKLLPKRDSASVEKGLIEMLREVQNISGKALYTITPDRGSEFAAHERVTEALDGLAFYFPPPHCPWERGTNENTNGLIREYCPKSVDMVNYSEEYIAFVADQLNHRPRKCLDWKTPYEVFFESVLHLT